MAKAPLTWWWLSYGDPVKRVALGVVIVQARSLNHAAQVSAFKGLSPRDAQVAGHPLPTPTDDTKWLPHVETFLTPERIYELGLAKPKEKPA